jgi:hypothetical protein
MKKNRFFVIVLLALIIALVLAGCRDNPKALAKQTYNVTVEVLSNPQKAEKSLEKAAAIKQKLAKLTSAERQLYNEELEDLIGQGVRALAILGGLPDGDGGSMGKALDAVLEDISATDSDGDNDGGGFISRLLGGFFGSKSKTASESDSWKTAESSNTTGEGMGGMADSGTGDNMGNATWTAVDVSGIFGDRSINAIAYGGGRFVAGGNSGIMATSTDGITWTALDTGTVFEYVLGGRTRNYDISAIAYGNNRFVAVGSGGVMATSTDGTTWSNVDVSRIFGRSFIDAIAYGNNRFVAFGQGGEIATSTDGTTWSEVTTDAFDYVSPEFGATNTDSITGIAYGNNMFVTTGVFVEIATSTDGTTWTAADGGIFGSRQITAIAYGSGKFVAGSQDGRMATSTNGTTWTVIDVSGIFGTSIITTIAYGSGKFVAGSENGTMATSTDGTAWAAVDTGTVFEYNLYGTTNKGNIRAIVYGSGRFVAIGLGGKMAYLPD